MMTRKERFLLTIDRKRVDRPAGWIGIPHKDSLPALCAYFSVADEIELSQAVNDDVIALAVPYHSPHTDQYHCAFRFSKLNKEGEPNIWSLTDPGIFEDVEDPAEIEAYDWPDPEGYVCPEEYIRKAACIPEDMGHMALLFSAHFQDLCSAFGMARAFEKMLLDPPIVHAVKDRIERFYLKANKSFFEATRGKVDCIFIANDMGAQRNLMLSPALVREFVLPTTYKIIQQAHEYGVRVLYHSCGHIYDIMEDLIGAGADAIHPMQPVDAKMSAQNLQQNFADRVSFFGGMDVQHLMVHGSVDDVKAAVRKLVALFPTGLVVSPSHETLLPDIPPANVEAMCETLRAF